MPNQRHSDKRNISLWLSAELYDRMKAAAAAIKLPMSTYITALLMRELPPSEHPESNDN